MSQPPPRPPGHISLADVQRFFQNGGPERAVSDLRQAATKRAAEVWSAAQTTAKRSGELVGAAEARVRQWRDDGGPERLRAGVDAFGTQLRATGSYAKTNPKWSYLADRMGGFEGATLMFALTGRELSERSPNLTATQRRLALVSGDAWCPRSRCISPTPRSWPSSRVTSSELTSGRALGASSRRA